MRCEIKKARDQIEADDNHEDRDHRPHDDVQTLHDDGIGLAQLRQHQRDQDLDDCHDRDDDNRPDENLFNPRETETHVKILLLLAPANR